MKENLLITGVSSYIGNHLYDSLKNNSRFIPRKISLKDINIEDMNLSAYHTIFHVAGLAHTKLNKRNMSSYYTVNYELTKKISNKAKSQGVKHFIFMSSMHVYSSKETIITKTIPTNPSSHYGKSKLQAETHLKEIASDSFKVSILRPAMIYGYKSRGNFPRLIRFTKKLRLFPSFENKRSFLYIDNLIKSSMQIIDKELEGVFHLANPIPRSTTEMVSEISKNLGIKIRFIRMNHMVRFLRQHIEVFSKLFSDYYYDDEMLSLKLTRDYCDFSESIKQTLVVDSRNEE